MWCSEHSPHILKRCRPLALKSSNNKSHGRSSPDYCRPLHFFSARRVRAEPLGALLSLFCPAFLNLYDSRFCRTGLISSRLLVMPPLWPGPKPTISAWSLRVIGTDLAFDSVRTGMVPLVMSYTLTVG